MESGLGAGERGAESSFLVGAVWAAVGGSLFFLPYVFFKPESYFKLLSGELLKATRLRPHVL